MSTTGNVPAIPPVPEEAGAVPVNTAMVFVTDDDSEAIVRQCLNDLTVPNAEFIKNGVKGAIAALKERSSPRLLVVNIQGVDDPVASIQELANVCDPQTGVVVIGDVNDIRIYRSLKAAGVVEYFYKPLVRSLVMQTCHGILLGNTELAPSRDGKLIFVVSVRGGSGGTMIAAATAWYLAEINKRRVGLIDMDLQFGDAALQLDVAPTHALKEALDHPERVDALFLDRAVIHVGERLGLLAGMEPLGDIVAPDEAAAMSLVEHMLHRCRYVFVDVPSAIAPRLLHLLHLPGTILLVSTGSLASARDVVRWRAMLGANTAERTTVHVLNKSGANDGLSDEEFTRAIGAAPDLKIPYSRDIGTASLLGVRGLQNCAALQEKLVPLYRQLSGEKNIPVPRSGWRAWFG